MHLDPEALEIIINKKAEEFTDADIDALIAHFRKERENFSLAEAAGKRAPKATKPVDPDLAKLLDGI
jgi:hypothetical protein